MPTEEEVNKKLDDAMEKYMRENERLQRNAVSEVDGVRKDIIDTLEENVDGNDKISKTKVRKILKKLDSIEDAINERMEEAIVKTLEKSSDKAVKWSVAALGSLIAADAISGGKVRKKVRESVLGRKSLKDNIMSDRIESLSGSIIDSVRSDIRYEVRKGSSPTKINRVIKKSFKKNEWKIQRMVMTEGYNAYRYTIGEIAKQTDAIEAVKIIDNRGRHPYHETHECYRLAEQDKYGWGKGIYRPEDDFIYFPHPQCTAYYQYILKDDDN